MRPIVRVENLGKRYKIGAPQSSHGTLRDALNSAFRTPLKRLRRAAGTKEETMWALQEVSFEVEPGEIIGIIGRNGAGKSTLLKLLSRITEPTTGRIELYGRVASLLEVGTGFNMELTGRENIYLNGAILGMSRAEIDRNFDEIVAFSEVERFIDTPVKHYSSGMYMRLAFAIAAHLEPEILIVDEVLAVGDAAFQQKSLGKMGEVSKQGRTVFFVSHNIQAIASLCTRCLWIDDGTLVQDGDAAQVTAAYQASFYSGLVDGADLSGAEHYGSGKARFLSVHVTPVSNEDEALQYLVPGQDLLVDLKVVANDEIANANVAIIVYDSAGYRLIDANTALQGSLLTLGSEEEAHVRFRLHNVLLKPGTYMVGLWMGRPGIEDMDGITYADSFTIEPNTETAEHTETFPGVYQCLFTHDIRTAAVKGNPKL
jgi:lipopolysaccharide transport system ATP-binding protein